MVRFLAAILTLSFYICPAFAQSKKIGDSTEILDLIKQSNKFRTEKVAYAKAKKYAEDAINLANTINFKKGIFLSNISYGYVLRDMGMRAESISALKKALSTFETNSSLISDQSLRGVQISTCTALSEVYSYIPDYSNAENYAFKALELSNKYSIQSGQCWITLSILFSRQQNFSEAKKYAWKALEAFQKENSKENIARVYSFLGKYATNDHDAKKAIEFYNLSYQNYKEANSLYGMRIALYNTANVYLKIRDFKNSERFISETFKITNQDDIISQLHINQLHFDIKFNKADYKEASKIAQTVLKYALLDKGLENVSAAYNNIYKTKLALKDTSGAFIAIEKISSLKDSLFNIEIVKKTTELSKKYETERQQQQILLLEKEGKLNLEKLLNQTARAKALSNENELTEEKLQREVLLRNLLTKENQLRRKSLAKEEEHNKALEIQNYLMQKNSKIEFWLRILLVIICIGCIIFATTSYRNFIKQRSSSYKIMLQKEELKILMKELHHRVKNNIQMIIAMLRMQARNIDDSKAIDILKNSETRLQAIALIHEKLYKKDQIDSLSLGKYLNTLMESLSVQYKSDTDDFRFQINDPDELLISLDTAISVGLIVNELVTNSFKHGFTINKSAEINIDLQKKGDQYEVVVQDNGIGIEDWESVKLKKSFGLKMIQLFTDQLKGYYLFENNAGCRFTLWFPIEV